MANVKGKYIKDEEGNTFSPITSIDTIFDSAGNDLKTYFLNLFYPVGSIYTTEGNTNPNTAFGGTWEEIKGRFLVGVGKYNKANTTNTFGDMDKNDETMADSFPTTTGATGGELTHTLTESQMPTHKHYGIQVNPRNNVYTYWDYIGLEKCDAPSWMGNVNNAHVRNLSIC